VQFDGCVPTVSDRIAQTTVKMWLEPRLDPIFHEDSYGYRPGKSALEAVVAAGELLFRGHSEVVDADLADYFGSIPHAELLKSVARRIVDRRVLHLIRMWLDCPVEETGVRRHRQYGDRQAKDMTHGTFPEKSLEVSGWFDPLNPYETKGPLFKVEDVNYGVGTKDLAPLY
jgi:RNA-directed DNA polymerase